MMRSMARAAMCLFKHALVVSRTGIGLCPRSLMMLSRSTKVGDALDGQA